ncbi:AP-4 complex accessory subunit RUSC2 isoform X1 [Serinus canaria]|uniref:AP-4 complex accessory subunit RUSC2 isoform X1 n=1 Tax=Serinus canaria TaxID=9135 RepID=UPI0021CCD85C|nr:AP-4 complex accessory subunit RUSC2 isoform X1 [Serinus canaria]XP_018778478.3 AP-4 complex accessory subunit RUSC2 isoform X1 [Serinus canaria]XP_018778479.3 AP-4 complex accessory subunit RUSC2 isoform X1 [Serinus canaria]XP_018778480.3 AP-4 complex accessory subunit RUSC2 isoform X1 [Serinus canaria]XP_018778481.3 AP-4 complex accessory subunit RUSC2 isoform X1 [Serinus canaria]XP_050842611.1 AP-4 complex accessory subunit RUSC2 isoform X1 [Serinus canaria]XP_050842612.1 AP-4 complex a
MDSPPKLTGETLIVHHIPLVHCQVPDRQCCSVSKRTNPFCQPELSITRTSALPDRDLSQTDSLVYSSFLQTSETSAEGSDHKERKARDLIVPSVSKRHNPFLLSEGEDLSIFGDDLGQKSFHLHNSLVDGKPPFNLQDLALPPFHLHDSNHIVKSWNMASRSGVVDGQEDKLSSDDIQKRNNANRCHQASERMELDECSCHRGSSSNFSFDSGDQEWNQNTGEPLRNQDALHRTCSCSSSEIQHCRCYSSSSQSEVIDQQMGYISDSSCNSSDGVLVNFSALYNKMNGQPQSNLNSANLSCDSSFCSHSDTGAFYLDLHSSPTESKMSCESHNPESSGKVCGCQHSSSPVLDANCNSYHLHCEPCTSESSDLTACFQSQARLVVATQNYYKLVTCDLSSQSSPSPAGSSITSCSEDQTKGSPAQPTEYYLFRRPDLRQEGNVECSEEEPKRESSQNMIEGQVYVNVSPPNLNTSRQRSRSYDQNLDRSPSSRLGSLERMVSCPVKLSESPAIPIQSSPPKRVTSFAELAKGRKKNGTSPPHRSSGDSSLEFSPIPETQRDCPTFLEERARRSQSLPPMPFIHGLNRSCEGFCLNHAFGDSQAFCSTKDSISSEKAPSGHGAGEQASLSLLKEADASFSGGSASGHGQKDVRARADGGGTDSKPVVRYSKDQRPTTLPIQPFVFQHHFSKPPKARALHSHFASSLSQLYSLSSNRPASQQISTSQSSALATSAEQAVVAGSQAHGTLVTQQRSADGAASRGDGGIKKPGPETTRPSPLGSYSPVRCNVPFFQSVDSSSSPTSERAEDSQPPRSRSCPISANLLPTRSSPAVSAMQPSKATKADTLRQKENPKLIPKKKAPLEPSPPLSEYRLHSGSLPPLSVGGMSMSRVGGHADSHWRSGSETSSSGPLSSMGIRPVNANHLSPQALKWREYRRRNPLGLDRVSGLPSLAGSLDRRQQEPRLNRGNPIFELPGALSTSHFYCKLNGQSMRQLQLTYNDFFPDYFSLAEKPPAEFCLSPDGNTESISIDLLQKKGLVKAINTAVDLIVAHFGTSRDPGVKAKLGNSSVSPNVGHLILKYLCPAVRDILSDGLKAYVLDMIIGQRRNIPWSVVEASTQLGPSTKLLHSLYSKISQYTELTNHTMRFNAFIFGLLNIRSLEFWFNHLYNHEDIILAHYQPVGFLCLSHSVCQPLFEELLLLLQPLSLLPFNLDLLFEHHLMQMGKEQQQQKELLRVKQDLLLSVHSTLQLMRTRGSSEDPDGCSTAPETCQGGAQDGDISPEHSPQQAVSEKRVKGVGASCGEGDREEEQSKMRESMWEGKKDKQAGWWYQLMQTSQIYIESSAEGSKFIRSEKKKAALNPAPGSVETHKAPPPREGVVEGAEACPIAEGTLEERPKAASKPSPEAVEEPLEKPQQVVVSEEVKERSWPFWMGSPPDSVLTELKRSKEKEAQQRVRAAAAPQEDSSTSASEASQPIKWGHLFGSRKVQKEPRQPNRLPSGWLSLDKSVFQLVAQTVGASMWREAAPEPDPPHPEPPEAPAVAQPVRGMSPHPACSEVKALCHHIATEAGQLSFNKGDILQVISKVDGDWLQCSLGSEKGLVPIMYVTHPEDEDY